MLNYLIPDAEQFNVRALKREKDYKDALQDSQEYDIACALGNDWEHHETVADGNCILNSIALGLLYYRNNSNDLLINHDDFRKQFAYSFGLNPDTLTSDALSQVIDALLSLKINLNNPIIQLIIAKLRNVEHTALGTEKDQINQKIKDGRDRAIKLEAFENGDIKVEYSEEAIRILARQGTLYQLTMAYVLRLYCASHHKKSFTCNTDQVGEKKDIELTLDVTKEFGEYLDDTVIAFLANSFNLTIQAKVGEFGRIITYGTGDTKILIFNLRSAAGDSHFELVLPSSAEFLESRLKMQNAEIPKLVPSVSSSPR